MKYLHSLSEFELRRHLLADGRVDQQIFTRGGRTGKKVHTATSGSSCLGCGHWTRHNVRHFEITAAQADKMQRCEKCFGGKWLEAQPSSLKVTLLSQDEAAAIRKQTTGGAQ